MGSGAYRLHGSVKMDVAEVSAVFQSISKLDLTFVFLQGDLVVLEEKIRIKGAVNEYLRFSRSFDTEKQFESTAWA